jgi:hypothetical protein
VIGSVVFIEVHGVRKLQALDAETLRRTESADIVVLNGKIVKHREGPVGSQALRKGGLWSVSGWQNVLDQATRTQINDNTNDNKEELPASSCSACISMEGRSSDCLPIPVKSLSRKKSKWMTHFPEIFDPTHPLYNSPNNNQWKTLGHGAIKTILGPSQERWLPELLCHQACNSLVVDTLSAAYLNNL